VDAEVHVVGRQGVAGEAVRLAAVEEGLGELADRRRGRPLGDGLGRWRGEELGEELLLARPGPALGRGLARGRRRSAARGSSSS
jgi:hypothetical protein